MLENFGFLNSNFKYFVNSNIICKHFRECNKLMRNIENFSDTNKTDFSETILKKKIKYKEILCPLTKDGIIVSNCDNCKYCQKMKGKHLSGRSLTSLICLYNSNKEGEYQ